MPRQVMETKIRWLQQCSTTAKRFSLDGLVENSPEHTEVFSLCILYTLLFDCYEPFYVNMNFHVYGSSGQNKCQIRF